MPGFGQPIIVHTLWNTLARPGRPARVLITVSLVLAMLPFTAIGSAHADPAPSADKGPIGWDSYRHPERMTEIGSGNRTRQFSSFDRSGGNDDGFEGTYSCLRTDESGCVIAEDTGAGEIDSIWFTRDEGAVGNTGRISIELDGRTVVDTSLQDLVDGKQGAPFVYPLVANADQSSGGVYIKVPMPYRESMRVTTQNNPLFHHVTYRDFPDAEGVATFDPADPAEDVIATLSAAGTADPKPPLDGAVTTTGEVDVPAGDTATVGTAAGPGAISALRFTLPQLESGDAGSDALLHDARLRITFDGDTTVDAPLGEFFGTGLGLYEVKSLMFGVDPDQRTLSSWWLMPYRESAEIEIVNSSGTNLDGGTVELTSAADDRWSDALSANGSAGYFTAIANRADTVDGRDHVFADTTGRGRVVGVTETVEGHIETGNIRDYLEGDERLFTDGSLSPDMHGTGTEDFYEAGWYFNRGTFNAPMNGNPAHEEKAANCEFDCTGMYRLFVSEGLEFDSSLRFGIEHGPADNEPALVGSTTFLYRQSDSHIQWTDSVDVGDTDSEAAHDYTSEAPGDVTTVTGGFAGQDGPVAPVELTGRATESPVSFTMDVAADNTGVVLRRISDHTAAYQAAEVTVDGVPVGTWRQPLGNESARWLDDSFTLPSTVTSGRDSVTIGLTPLDGHPAFHAAGYAALSIVDESSNAGAPTVPDNPVAAGETSNAVSLRWQPSTDDVYAPHYRIYGSREPGFTPGEDNLLGTSRIAGFRHTNLGVNETWYYRVRAVDAAGNAGETSGEFTGTSGATMRLEAEDLLPAQDATATAERQADCCGVHWSNGAQVWFQPHAADQSMTLEFTVPDDGDYTLTVFQTRAPDYGATGLALDGEPLGDLDGYAPELDIAETGYGPVRLDAGPHRLTVTVSGKNDASTDYMAGLDCLDLVAA